MWSKESAQDRLSGTQGQLIKHIIPCPHRSVFAGSEREVLQQDDHSHFHNEESKPHSYAVPGASPKRQEGVGVNRLSAVFREPDYKNKKEVRKSYSSRMCQLSVMRCLGRQKFSTFLCILEEPSKVPYFCCNRYLMLVSCCLELAVYLQVHQVSREHLKDANGFHNCSFLRTLSQLKN